MTAKLTRRDFLKFSFISLAAIVSACAKVLSKPDETATPVQTATLDTTPKTYAPDDPHILYTGRIDFTDPQKPGFSAPGVYIQARFRGTSAFVMLQDEFKYGTLRNYYDAVIDEAIVVKIAPVKTGTMKYPVASGLPYGEHTLTLIKRTEASIGSCRFLGFEFDGGILPAPAAPSRRAARRRRSVRVPRARAARSSRPVDPSPATPSRREPAPPSPPRARVDRSPQSWRPSAGQRSKPCAGCGSQRSARSSR